MRLVTYDSGGAWRAGIIVGGWVVDAAAAVQAANLAPIAEGNWASNRQIIQAAPEQLAELERAAHALTASGASSPAVYSIEDLLFGPPIPDPEKIICLGLNYHTHAQETNLTVAEVPTLFAKYRNTLIGPTSPICLPGYSQEIDYEAELAAVIGRKCRDVTVMDALSYVAGYMAFNDVSARDLQFHTSQWLSGKTLDTFAPCGPALVMGEIADPQALKISTRLNGQTLQAGHTGDMIFPVAESIAYISKLVTLQPGDIIATGTPDGVGFKRTPPIFLHHGDLVEVEVEGVGTLHNPVVGPGL